MTDAVMEELRELLQRKPPLHAQTGQLEFMAALSDREIQLVLRETDLQTLTRALAGASDIGLAQQQMLRIFQAGSG